MDVLFVPSSARGNGTGHLRRCIKYSLSDHYNGFIYLPDMGENGFLEDESFKVMLKPVFQKSRYVSVLDRHWDIIVTDRRETPLPEFEEYLNHTSLLVGLDEGGACRGEYHYLIDTLPSLSGIEANIYSTGLLDVNDRRSIEKDKGHYRNILVSFGGEDPENLTDRVVETFAEKEIDTKYRIQVVRGPLFSNDKWHFESDNITVVDAPQSLAPFIENADLVITSFGLTAYESLYAGKDVLLVNPSEYHNQLSSAAGIPVAGLKGLDTGILKTYLDDPSKYPGDLIRDLDKTVSMEELIAGLTADGGLESPFCGKKGIAAARFENRTYYRCPICGLIYMKLYNGESVKYNENYFFADYKNQYGKTYIEDFENIKKISLKRLKRIKRYRKEGDLLDIGCAFGPFLKAADESGYNSAGFDVSEEAVEYIKNNLGIDSKVVDFSVYKPEEGEKFDIITMWYVIEHFKNPEIILSKVSEMLSDNGIFAFSTPNYTGISGRKDLKKALSESPSDHFTYWSIKSAGKILRKGGFRILSVRNTGHHPERFPGIIRKFIPDTLLKYISYLVRSGDTFEIYVQKQAE